MTEQHVVPVQPLTEQQQRIWHAHAVRRLTQHEIARELGVTQQSISEQLQAIRAKIGPPDVNAVRAELMEVYANTMRRAQELAEMAGAPVTAGKDGDVVVDPSSGEVVRDYALRLNALKLANETTAHLRKLLGLDAAEKVELSGGVRYELVGVQVEDLT